MRIRPIISSMTPRDLFDDCRLAEAIAAQQVIVRTGTDDGTERLFLSELLAFAGRRDDARVVLSQIDQDDPNMADYVAGWKQILTADDARHAGTPANWIILPPLDINARASMLPRLNNGTEDIDRLEELNEEAPWLVGHIDGREFDGWRDADDILAPVLEAFVGERYVWIPLGQIRKLRCDDERDLRDRLYRPVTVWMTDGGEWDLIIPALYTGTATHADEAIRMGADTDWSEVNGVLRGAGLRTFLFGEEELAIGEFTQVEIRPS